jgi:SAM-dependent methyltransferase
MDRNTNKQMEEMLSPDDMMMPQEPPTPEAIAEGKQAAKEIFYESFPGIGEAASVARVKKELEEEDYTGAAIETAAGLVGMLPLAGDIVGKGIRSSANALRTPKWFKETKVDTDLAPDSSRKTQITTTTPTYRKVRDLLPEGKTLDFGSGKGVGAKDVGFDTYEPFPDADFIPNYSSAKDIPDESYENVTSLNVLNVVKPETRTQIVSDIGRILKPGGTAIITTRGADVFGNAKNPVKGVLGDEPGSVITSSGTYQKGFTQAELQEYVQETLGEGFEVVNISGAGQAGVKITKTQKNSSVTKPPVRTTKSPLRVLFDKLPETERTALPPQPDENRLFGYHGTAKAREADEPFFDINFARKNDQFLGEGFYFTLDPEVASEYASIRGIKSERQIKGEQAKKILADENVIPSERGKRGSGTSVEVTPQGEYVTGGSMMKGQDIYGNPVSVGQYIGRFDLSNLEKPYVVRTENSKIGLSRLWFFQNIWIK